LARNLESVMAAAIPLVIRGGEIAAIKRYLF
jgi:hypothetical protein